MSNYVVVAVVLGDADWPVLNYWSAELDQWSGYGEATRYTSEEAARSEASAVTPLKGGVTPEAEPVLPVDLDGFAHRDGKRVTPCCAALPTFHDTTLCCKSCGSEVASALLVEARLP